MEKFEENRRLSLTRMRDGASTRRPLVVGVRRNRNKATRRRRKISPSSINQPGLSILINLRICICSRQQFPSGERTDSRLPHSVLQRVVLQDFRLQPRRGDAEVVQVRLHVRRADGQGDHQQGGPRAGAPAARPVRDPPLQEKQ